MKKYIACFDISDDKSRAAVAKTLLNHGRRVQHSVFEVAFTGVQAKLRLEELMEELHSWLDEDDDLRFYHLCENCCQKSVRASGDQIAQFSDVLIT